MTPTPSSGPALMRSVERLGLEVPVDQDHLLLEEADVEARVAVRAAQDPQRPLGDGVHALQVELGRDGDIHRLGLRERHEDPLASWGDVGRPYIRPMSPAGGLPLRASQRITSLPIRGVNISMWPPALRAVAVHPTECPTMSRVAVAVFVREITLLFQSQR